MQTNDSSERQDQPDAAQVDGIVLPRRLRKVYCLKVRPDDSSEWSEADIYDSKKKRDADAAFARIIGGYRTHSFERYEK